MRGGTRFAGILNARLWRVVSAVAVGELLGLYLGHWLQ